ncbi:MAG: DUF3604 domain-containing protein [Candidatus Hydrogenedentes bacterium]|nr:DUF3604 domain-containing protein [Candidatus Hydrogenedentota bacterium]
MSANHRTSYRPSGPCRLTAPALAALLGVLIGASSCTPDPRPEPQPQSEPATSSRDAVPRIVPYFDAVPSPEDGHGRAVLSPSEPVCAGSQHDFEIAFTVGEHGIAVGGFVLLQISPWWGWSEPQTERPQAPGYIEVAPSFTDPSLQVMPLSANRVLVFSRTRQFRPGDTLTFSYANARVDRFAEAAELFQFFVDADGDGHSAPIAEPPTLRILPREAARLTVNAPPQVVPGVPIRITAAPLDALGNWTAFPPGEYTLTPSRPEPAATHPLPPARLQATENDTALTFSWTPNDEGVLFFDVEGPGSLTGRSNVCLCQNGTPSLNLYFGDIHGHSRMSDGTGSPEDYYRYARTVSGLDIAALTDHVDFGTLRIEGARWHRIRDAANAAYEPGRFTTLVGYEWTNWVYGHRNVYFRGDDGPVFRSFDENSDTPQELWRLLEPFDAMTIAHHVGGGPVAIDWSIPPGDNERLVEICSIHGSCEAYGGPASIYRPVQGAFVRDALARGYRLGIIGSGDTHDGHPGQRSASAQVTGLLAVYAPQLTREAIWNALKRRQVYATSGPKIILNFQVARSPMGSEILWAGSQGPVPIAIRSVCCDEIDLIEVIRCGETIYRKEGDGFVSFLLLEDPKPIPGVTWYYVRVTQKDGNMAWSSPIWLEYVP